MLPRPGSTLGDAGRLEGTTERLERDDRQRLIARSPAPSFAYKITWCEFVSFGREVAEAAIFVPLLGFEGTRFMHMLEDVQPQREDICPIVGVPGFRPEYPFYSYHGNREPLEQTKAWKNVRFAAVNCPFSVYHVIGAIAEDGRGRRLKIGLIGTKPHALGGILYISIIRTTRSYYTTSPFDLLIEPREHHECVCTIYLCCLVSDLRGQKGR